MPSIVYDLALVEDRGSYYQVLGTTKNTFDVVANSEEKYLKLSSIAADMLHEALAKGGNVRLPKSLQSNEVLPGELEIIIPTDSEIDAVRNNAMYKAKQLVTFELGKISSFTLYKYNILHDELAAEGYFITNKNREQKYIEIIETGDADLISSLEKYLEARDTIDRAIGVYDKLNAYMANLNNLSTVDEIATAQSAFLSNFYQNS